MLSSSPVPGATSCAAPRPAGRSFAGTSCSTPESFRRSTSRFSSEGADGATRNSTNMTVRELRFDGQVALITGAGGQQPNLGATYAKLLASRGAKVVVNDLGV